MENLCISSEIKQAILSLLICLRLLELYNGPKLSMSTTDSKIVVIGIFICLSINMQGSPGCKIMIWSILNFQNNSKRNKLRGY
jgi:hypothetical protein